MWYKNVKVCLFMLNDHFVLERGTESTWRTQEERGMNLPGLLSGTFSVTTSGNSSRNKYFTRFTYSCLYVRSKTVENERTCDSYLVH